MMMFLPEPCGPGSYSRRADNKCTLCQRNSYAYGFGKHHCTKCPSGSITFRKGSWGSQACKGNNFMVN